MPAQLPNYLRTHRKRLGLSQEEVAFLLGTRHGDKVCRYERFIRQASLEAALACEVIFQKSVRDLFFGLYQKIERNVAARAKVLSHRTARRGSSRHTARKCLALNMIASGVSKPKAS